MDPKRHERLSIVAPLAVRVEPDADVAQFVAAVIATFNEIATVLAPIIGRGGVAALYKRSVHLASRTHPWLAEAAEDAEQPLLTFASLHAVLERQSQTQATEGGHHLLQVFRDLLASLIGPALTGQLLGTVWVAAPSPPPAENTLS